LNVRLQHKPALVMRQYATAQTIFSRGLLFIVILFEHYLKGIQLFPLSAFIIVGLINSGAIPGQRRWIFYLEYIRVVIVMIAIAVFYPNNRAFNCMLMVLLLMIRYFRAIQRYYFKLLYTKATS
jgi:alkylglycerol monooxygenase